MKPTRRQRRRMAGDILRKHIDDGWHFDADGLTIIRNGRFVARYPI